MPVFPTADSQAALTDYSHSDVFTTLYKNGLPTTAAVVAPLTTVYTPPPSCSNRWMKGGDPYGPNLTSNNVYSLNGDANNRLWTTCQARSPVPDIYSPGVCPWGYVIAEVTEHQTRGSSGIDSYWQASCCLSNMSFGPNMYPRCRRPIGNPVQAFAPLATLPGGLPNTRSLYEIVTSTVVRTSDGTPVYSTTTINNITWQEHGFVIADPIVVAWQSSDLKIFPTSYASSLAGKIGITFTAMSEASPTSPGVGPTNSGGSKTDSPNNPLTVGAKVGISMGVVVALVLIGSLVAVVRCMRQRRRSQSEEHGSENEVSHIKFPDGILRNEAENTERIELPHGIRSLPELGLNAHSERSPAELDGDRAHEMRAQL